MADAVLFYYFGDDEAYFRALQGEFGLHSKLPIQFKRFYATSESKIQSLFLKIYEDKPLVVFIDFSKETNEYMHFARLIARTPLEHKFATVGLVDYLSPWEVLEESIATGIDLTHIKSTETFDVVFDVLKIVAPQEMSEHGFATANLKEDVEAWVPAKIGYVQEIGLHFETNYQIAKGSRVKLRHFWQKNKTIPSAEVFVKAVSNKNLFYHFNLSADVEFIFVDDLILQEGVDPDEFAAKKADRQEQIQKSKDQLKKWITEHQTNSQEKKGKMLVVDRELRFYQDQPRSDKHPYIIRCIPSLEDIPAEMDRLQPNVIAFALDKPEVENPRNHHQRLVKLAEAIKVKYRDLNPFIVVFNSPVSSKEMQEVLGYTSVMATDHELSVDLLVKMADLFEKKRATPMMVGKKANEPEKVFLSKSDPASLCEIQSSIKIVKISETDLYFTTDQPITVGMNLHLLSPVEMYVNVRPTKNPSNPPVYHGLIHSLGEAQKKDLRRYVNSVFFRDHDAQVLNEAEEFKKLNEAKLQERIAEAARKVEEEAKRKEQERQEKEEAEKKALAAANEPKS